MEKLTIREEWRRRQQRDTQNGCDSHMIARVLRDIRKRRGRESLKEQLTSSISGLLQKFFIKGHTFCFQQEYECSEKGFDLQERSIFLVILTNRPHSERVTITRCQDRRSILSVLRMLKSSNKQLNTENKLSISCGNLRQRQVISS